MTDEREEPGTQRRRIKVLIREEDMEAVEGQSARFSGLLPDGADVVEGQVYVLRVPKPGDRLDTEAEGLRWGGLGQTEEDVESQGARGGYLEPATAQDVEGQGYRGNFFREADDDTEGQAVRGSWFVPDDDTEGQWGRVSGLAPDDDTEGHGLFPGRPPVDH